MNRFDARRAGGFVDKANAFPTTPQAQHQQRKRSIQFVVDTVEKVLSEESRRASKLWPPVVSSGNPTPFGKGGRSVELEVFSIVEVAFLVEMVVERSVD